MNPEFKNKIIEMKIFNEEAKKHAEINESLSKIQFGSYYEEYDSLEESKNKLLSGVHEIQKINQILTTNEITELSKLLTKFYDGASNISDELIKNNLEKNTSSETGAYLGGYGSGSINAYLVENLKSQDCINSGVRLRLNKFNSEGKNKEKYSEFIKFISEQKDVLYKPPFVLSDSISGMEVFEKNLNQWIKRLNVSGNIQVINEGTNNVFKYLVNQDKLGATIKNFDTFTYNDLEVKTVIKKEDKSTKSKLAKP